MVLPKSNIFIIIPIIISKVKAETKTVSVSLARILYLAAAAAAVQSVCQKFPDSCKHQQTRKLLFESSDRSAS